MYLREKNNDSLGSLLKGLPHDERYLQDTNNWVSHALLKVLYDRMIHILGDENTVYEMALASVRFQSLGLLDGIVRLLIPAWHPTKPPAWHFFSNRNMCALVGEP